MTRAFALLLVAACTPDEGTTGTTGHTGTTPPAPDPDALSALGILEWDGSEFTYGEGVEAYGLASPLFSDYAVKHRAMRLPDGTSAGYVDNDVLDFPVGTVIVKSFLFPADLRQPSEGLRLIETRVMTLQEDGWDAWPYVWADDGSDAYKAPSGTVVDVSFVDLRGDPVTFPYLVPQRNQCVDCHEVSSKGSREKMPIGPKPRHLNVDGQLERWIDSGFLTGAPPVEEIGADVPFASVTGVDLASVPDEVLFPAARDYLDINCAHCHDSDAEEGRSSQLFLNWDNEDPFSVGVCKRPGSAGGGSGGLTFDIVPGKPEESILVYRMQTTTLGEMMPDLGRLLVDDAGVALVSEWVRRLEGTCSE